jgi:ribosomal protein S5
MSKKLPSGLGVHLKNHRPNNGPRIRPAPGNIALNRDPKSINGVPFETRSRGIRNTKFRLPYLSNLRKMDPVFDDPYDVAAQTIRKTRKPGDPEVILDPDVLPGGVGDYSAKDLGTYYDIIPKDLNPPDPLKLLEQTNKYKQLMDDTGLSQAEIEKIKMKTLLIRWPMNQTRMGKIGTPYCLAIAGNGNGMVGFGEARGMDARIAIQKSTVQAIKRMEPVERYEQRTVYGEVEASFGATKVSLRPRPPGFGIRANYYINEICKAAGISDIGAKVTGSKNGMNVAKAVFEALRKQKTPSVLAKQRGMHIIDVRELYFHGR